MEKMKGEIGEEERSNCDNQADGKLKVRILVVDDSLLDRKVVERLLNKSEEGFEVITVDNGKKAMDILGLNEAETEPAAINVSSLLIDCRFTKLCFIFILIFVHFSVFYNCIALPSYEMKSKLLFSYLSHNDRRNYYVRALDCPEANQDGPRHPGRQRYIANGDDQSIDIVLTDYCMPGMTGYDLLKAVKGQSFPKPIPVVVMSSENEPQRISRAIGAEDFILKPIQIKDVQRLRNYARPNASSPIIGTKRKMKPLELATESGGSEKRPRLAGVVVA
ncbi:hypothetical protein IEQ34_011124 [Dendrobium chrysotoxum]|uniref:Response regulatory domain-containing protein n=1 Tax=Dendrobium chrysotoxum TaxID=161865 RepID=A0AAV7GWN7_DENCH|nr:hypothetical protein IEQ34_011124 [Dendrobium chrysotoxum]